LEGLEIRQVLSAVVGPTPAQQYALELINFVRTDPSAAATMFVKDITPDVQDTLAHYGLTASGLVSELDSATPQPALAWSDSLGSTAQGQSQYEANTGQQTHSGPNGVGLGTRIANAGYANASSYGENTYAWADNADEAMLSFLFDWGVSDHGHYANIMQPGVSAQNAYKDVGIGLVDTSNQGLGPVVITQDFGAQQNEGPQIVGSIFNDPNNTKFYTPGQGLAGVTITAVDENTGATFTTTSFGSGGFELPVTANSFYKVTAVQNGMVLGTQTINVEGVNAQVEFVHNPANDTPVTSPVVVAAPTPAPAPAPVPVPAPAPTPTPAPAPTLQAPQIPTTDTPTAEAQLLFSLPELGQTPTAPSTTTAPSWITGWSRWTAGKVSAQ
jgi:uncharacterized protein YkwD